MRAPRHVLATLLASLLPLALVAVAPSPVVAAGPAPSAAVAPPGVADDFPRLPAQCYDDKDVITSPCRVTTFEDRPVLVLMGDSHAQMYLPAVRQLAQANRLNLVALLFGGCPVSTPFPRSAGYPRTGCENHNLESLDYLRRLHRNVRDVQVIVGGFWSGYRLAHELAEREARGGPPSGLSDYRKQMAALAVERSRSMFRKIGEIGVPVDLVGQAATVPLDPRACRAGREPYQCDLPRRRALNDERGNEQWIRRNLIAPLPGQPRLIDPSPTYCSSTTCFARVDGINTFYDDIHLGADLTRTMRRYFRPTVQALLAR